MRHQVLTLDVKYDPNETERPAWWDWDALVDAPASTVTIIAAGPIEPLPMDKEDEDA